MEIKELINIANKYYDSEILDTDASDSFSRLRKLCSEASGNQENWILFLNSIKAIANIEITEFVLLKELNPSFIAVFLTEEYKRPKPKGYQPMQLVLKLSVLAPTYHLYFDNLDSENNKRLIRTNPITDKENLIFNKILEKLNLHYPGYSQFDFSNCFYSLSHLDNISDTNSRKPYLDECIFGLYLSIHPHNILNDRNYNFEI